MKNRATFQSNLSELNSDVWGYALLVPNEIAVKFIEGTNRRVVCAINGIDPFRCGILGAGNGNFMILLNKKRRIELERKGITQLVVSIEKDNSEYGMEISAEFLEVLSQYREASVFFDALTPGKKRTLIYWADNVKSSDIKIRRAIVVCEHLIKQNGVPDFKKMNEEIKIANARFKRDAR